MVLKYNQYVEVANTNLNFDPTKDVAKTFKYFAYKNGVATEFPTWNEAQKHSKMVEKVEVDNPEYKTYQKTLKDRDAQAFNNWYADLREDYSYVNDKVFDLCYDEAYEDGHAYGHDEVANKMEDIIDFAEAIKNALK